MCLRHNTVSESIIFILFMTYFISYVKTSEFFKFHSKKRLKCGWIRFGFDNIVISLKRLYSMGHLILKSIVLPLNYQEFDLKILSYSLIVIEHTRNKSIPISTSKKMFFHVEMKFQVWEVFSTIEYLNLIELVLQASSCCWWKISEQIQIDNLSYKCSIWELNLENTTPTLCIFFRFSWNLFFGSIDQDKNAFQIFSLVIAWTEK